MGPIGRLAVRLAQGDERRGFISGDRYWFTITVGVAAGLALAFSPLGLVVAGVAAVVAAVMVTGLFVYGDRVLKRKRAIPTRERVLGAMKRASHRLPPEDEQEIRALLDAGFPEEALARLHQARREGPDA